MSFTCRIPLAFCLALTLLFLSQTDALAQLDQVFAEGGVPIEGTVTDMNKRQVILTKSGAKKPYESNTIRMLNFADDPSEMKRVRRSVMEGRFNDAMNELKKIDMANVKVEFVRQDVQYYKAFVAAKLAMKGEGKLKDAGSAMYNFVKGYPQNFHYYDAVMTLGDLSHASGVFPLAETSFTDIAKSAPWPDYKTQATLRLAKTQLAQNEFSDALQNFELVIGSSTKYEGLEEHKQFAQFGKAICMAATDQADQAIAMVETIIRDSDPKNMSLFGQAYNALGSCYIKAGKNKEALLAYLHTDILFFGDSNTHAEALYYLNYLWGKENQSDRAVRAASILSSRYGGSIWATKPKMQ